MNLKKIFKYEPQNEYDFNIQSTENAVVQELDSEKVEEKIYKSITQNRDFMQSKFNALISSDVIIRDFSLICQNKEYRAFIILIIISLI